MWYSSFYYYVMLCIYNISKIKDGYNYIASENINTGSLFLEKLLP